MTGLGWLCIAAPVIMGFITRLGGQMAPNMAMVYFGSAVIVLAAWLARRQSKFIMLPLWVWVLAYICGGVYSSVNPT